MANKVLGRRVGLLLSSTSMLMIGGTARAEEPTRVVTVGDQAPADAGVVVEGKSADSVAQKTTVRVRSTSGSVTVALITDRMMGTGSAGGRAVAIQGMSYQDLCNSPCSFQIDSGIREFFVYGDGVSAASQKLDLRGTDTPLLVKPGSSGLAMGGVWLTVLGLTSALTAAIILPIVPHSGSYGWPMLIGGAAGTAGGILMIHAGSTSFEPDVAPSASAKPQHREASVPLSLSVSGAF